jgi:hypothetical protein
MSPSAYTLRPAWWLWNMPSHIPIRAVLRKNNSNLGPKGAPGLHGVSSPSGYAYATTQDHLPVDDHLPK